MQISHAIRERDRVDQDRISVAKNNPTRRRFSEPLDSRLECVLGRLVAAGKITEAEYEAGVRWRELYFQYLASIGAPFPFCQSPAAGSIAGDEALLADEICENVARAYKAGLAVLSRHGRRVRDAVNAVAVYDEPEELGDFEFTVAAARKGLAALATRF